MGQIVNNTNNLNSKFHGHVPRHGLERTFRALFVVEIYIDRFIDEVGVQS